MYFARNGFCNNTIELFQSFNNSICSFCSKKVYIQLYEISILVKKAQNPENIRIYILCFNMNSLLYLLYLSHKSNHLFFVKRNPTHKIKGKSEIENQSVFMNKDKNNHKIKKEKALIITRFLTGFLNLSGFISFFILESLYR